MRKIVLVNQKGGCGKTTTAINIASCLAAKGNKVLLIDLDPQGHSGLGLGAQPDQIEETIYEVLAGKIGVQQAIKPIGKNLSAVFSNVVLSAFEQLMAGAPDREYVLARCLAEIENSYDYLIIDSPPSVGLLTFNGLLAADEVIIPVDSSSFSLNGLGKLLETIQLIEKQTGHRLSFKILATNIDRRTRFGKSVVKSLRAQFSKKCFKTIINTCTRLREAAEQGKPIAEYDKSCAAWRDYQSLTKEILLQEAGRGKRVAKERQIVFSLKAANDAVVKIAGDFTDWKPKKLKLAKRRSGALWQTSIKLRPGSYQYKYLVNDRWIPDPTNKKIVDNGLGTANSLITV